MSDWSIVAGFFCMVLVPCVVALHASVQEDGPTLGYLTSLRRVRGKLIDLLRV